MRCGALAVLVLLVPRLVNASDERRVITMAIEAVAVPASGPILVDGKLSEEVWQRAPVITEFVQREPAEGQAATMRTEARVAYDAGAIYVAVRAFDTDASRLVGILTRRDQRSPSDWIRIVVDPYLDKRSGYEFGVKDRKSVV